MRVPWTARRSNQLILKEISPEYSLERLMLKLKLQYFGHLMQRADSLEKMLMLGEIEGRIRLCNIENHPAIAWESTYIWVCSSRIWRMSEAKVFVECGPSPGTEMISFTLH